MADAIAIAKSRLHVLREELAACDGFLKTAEELLVSAERRAAQRTVHGDARNAVRSEATR